MEKSYNSMAFVPEDVELGLHKELIDYLINYGQKSESHFNEVHITTDGYCLIVNWICRSYEESYGGRFDFVDEDEEVLKEVDFPDGHFEYIERGRVQEAIDEWLKENKGYAKDRYGRWYKEDEVKNLNVE